MTKGVNMKVFLPPPQSTLGLSLPVSILRTAPSLFLRYSSNTFLLSTYYDTDLGPSDNTAEYKTDKNPFPYRAPGAYILVNSRQPLEK